MVKTSKKKKVVWLQKIPQMHIVFLALLALALCFGVYRDLTQPEEVEIVLSEKPFEYTAGKRPTVTPVDTTYKSAFQQLFLNSCQDDATVPEDYHLKKIDINALPVTFNGIDATSAWCVVYGSYVFVPLDGNDESNYKVEPFLTVSDSFSYHCCHGPSSLDSAGKLVATVGDVDVYIHTGTWGEGPETANKPIIVRGFRQVTVSNGEELSLVLDRIAIDKNDSRLKEIEAKYRILDSRYDSQKYVLTPEVVDTMLKDEYFSNINENPVYLKVIEELSSINLK